MSTASREAEAALRATATADLLRNAHALTHRIHEASVTVRLNGGNGPTWAKQTEADLRAQRDLIDAEIIRRTEEVPERLREPLANLRSVVDAAREDVQ